MPGKPMSLRELLEPITHSDGQPFFTETDKDILVQELDTWDTNSPITSVDVDVAVNVLDIFEYRLGGRDALEPTINAFKTLSRYLKYAQSELYKTSDGTYVLVSSQISSYHPGSIASSIGSDTDSDENPNKISLLRNMLNKESLNSVIRGMFPMRLEHFKERYGENGDDSKAFTDLITKIREYEARVERENHSLKQSITDLASIYSMTNETDHPYVNAELNAMLNSMDVPAQLIQSARSPSNKTSGMQVGQTAKSGQLPANGNQTPVQLPANGNQTPGQPPANGNHTPGIDDYAFGGGNSRNNGSMKGGVFATLQKLAIPPTYTTTHAVAPLPPKELPTTTLQLIALMIEHQLESMKKALEEDPTNVTPSLEGLRTSLTTLDEALKGNQVFAANMFAHVIQSQLAMMQKTLEDGSLSKEERSKLVAEFEEKVSSLDSIVRGNTASSMMANIIQTQLAMIGKALDEGTTSEDLEKGLKDVLVGLKAAQGEQITTTSMMAHVIQTQLAMMDHILKQQDPVQVPKELTDTLERLTKLFDDVLSGKIRELESKVEEQGNQLRGVVEALQGTLKKEDLTADQQQAAGILSALHSSLMTAILEVLRQKEESETYGELLKGLQATSAVDATTLGEKTTLVDKILEELKTALDVKEGETVQVALKRLLDNQDEKVKEAIQSYIEKANTLDTEVQERKAELQRVLGDIEAKKVEMDAAVAKVDSASQAADAAVAKITATEAEKTAAHSKAMEDVQLQTEKLSGVIEGLGKIITDVKKGGMEGGAAPKTSAEQAKELRKTVDTLKGKIRDIDIQVEDLESRTEKLMGLIDKVDTATGTDAVGLAKTFEDDGKKTYTELQETIQTLRKQVEDVFKKLSGILEADPTNKRYMDRLVEVRNYVEGKFDGSEDEKYGILAQLDKMRNVSKSAFDTATATVKSKAASAKQEAENAKNTGLVDAAKTFFRRGGGGDKEGLNNLKDSIKGKLANIREIVKILDKDATQRNNPIAMGAVGSEPSMFLNLYNQYLQNKSDKTQFQAADTLSRSLEENKLLPRAVLEVTTLDKVIFIFVTLFVRLFALSIIEFMIEKDKIGKMVTALFGFLLMYTIILAGFVAFVNSDLYRMRIVFNYVNLHGSSAKIMTHILLLWLFSFLIFFIMWQVNPAIKEGESSSRINEEEKVNLIYRIQVLTMIVWLFLVLMIVMM